MHEWALAESIIKTTLDAANKEHLKSVTAVNISLGEMQQIEHAIFRFALKELAKSHQKTLSTVRFSLKTEPTTLQCTACQTTWTFQDMKKDLGKEEAEAVHFIPEVILVHARCPTCESPDFHIIKGRGVSILSIKGTR